MGNGIAIRFFAFICTFLPCTVRISKIDVTVQSFLDPAPVCELSSTVAGNRLDQLRRESRQHGNERIFHRFCFAVRNFDGDVKACLPLGQGGKAGLAFSQATYDCIRFPVTGFLAAVYRLVSFSDRLSLVVFPRVSLAPWLFPLRRSTFRFPFTRYFS